MVGKISHHTDGMFYLNSLISSFWLSPSQTATISSPEKMMVSPCGIISFSLRTKETIKEDLGIGTSLSATLFKEECSGSVKVQMEAFHRFRLANKCIPTLSTCCSIIRVIISVLLTA